MRSTRLGRLQGFSLLEMVVALAILSLSLGVLYQATGGATRNVSSAEEYAYGVELAQSLLASNQSVPLKGVNSRGETPGGFAWNVSSSPLQFKSEKLLPGSLHKIEISVNWQDGRKQRSVALYSVVPGFTVEPGRTAP